MNKQESKIMKAGFKAADSLIAALTADAKLSEKARGGTRGQKSTMRVLASNEAYANTRKTIEALFAAPTTKTPATATELTASSPDLSVTELEPELNKAPRKMGRPRKSATATTPPAETLPQRGRGRGVRRAA